MSLKDRIDQVKTSEELLDLLDETREKYYEEKPEVLSAVTDYAHLRPDSPLTLTETVSKIGERKPLATALRELVKTSRNDVIKRGSAIAYIWAGEPEEGDLASSLAANEANDLVEELRPFAVEL